MIFPQWDSLCLNGKCNLFEKLFVLCINTIFAEKMGRKRRRLFYEQVIIEDIGSEGKALVKVNDMVIFTRHAIPGDIVDLQIIKKRKNYMEAVITKFHKYSEERVGAFCTHFGHCGGCAWQCLPYKKQLYYKQKQVEEQLVRIGKIALPEIAPVLASEKETFYRNKLEFAFSDRRWLTKEEIESGDDFTGSGALGFHVNDQYDKVVNLEQCWLQPEPSNAIRNFVFKYATEKELQFFDIRNRKGFLRTLVIRTSSRGEVMVILTLFRNHKEDLFRLLDSLKDNFPSITSLMYAVNPKGNDSLTDIDIMLYHGRDYITEEMEGLKFRVGPKSFFQTNSEQAYNLYKIVREFASLTGNETVYDLYTGTGTIAQFIAANAGKVIGIDFISSAIDDAVINASLNRIGNVLFFTGDIKELLNKSFISVHGKPDVIITDPPRAGMHKDVIGSLLSILPYKIIYVSCNPATQARDLHLLADKYKVVRVQPVDMFPHTRHIENVVLLERALT